MGSAREVRLAQLKDWSQAKGTHLYGKYLQGERLTRGESLIAKCAECMGGYVDGRRDCRVELCPLYPYMPYRKDREEVTDEVADHSEEP